MKLLKIGASWCGPCQTMNKKLESFTLCDVIHYDVDNEDEETLNIVDKFKVRNIPVMVLVDDNGDEIKRWNGLTNIADIEKEIKSH
jgi:thioredoxin-like negative regulator of GroEL